MVELKSCPFLIQEDWCDGFDGPCAVVKGNRCEVHQQLAKRDARIAELEDTVRKLTGKERFRGDETILYAAHKETIAYKDKQIAELEAERDHFREVAEKLVWLYSDEHQERLDNGLRIDGFYSHEWLGMILDMAREALKGTGK